MFCEEMFVWLTRQLRREGAESIVFWNFWHKQETLHSWLDYELHGAVWYCSVAVAYSGGGGGEFKPPFPEIPKALQNRAKINPIVKTVKNSWI